MERLTSRRSGANVTVGYWSPYKKEALVQRLGRYEDLGLTPCEIKEKLKTYDDLLENLD